MVVIWVDSSLLLLFPFLSLSLSLLVSIGIGTLSLHPPEKKKKKEREKTTTQHNTRSFFSIVSYSKLFNSIPSDSFSFQFPPTF
ncbi:hypothetical protein RIF29_41806 [Crotalaria pallida]|uniref:Uncharacterized protein n=1 Tax=Crotalaria pallida TaxID=3830 RepID=A0AAN9E6C5_CROPI